MSDGAATATASLTIVVNEPAPAIEFNVTRADIDFKSRKSALAAVEIQAEFYAAVPAPDDVVALYVDGALVFAAPFGQSLRSATTSLSPASTGSRRRASGCSSTSPRAASTAARRTPRCERRSQPSSGAN